MTTVAADMGIFLCPSILHVGGTAALRYINYSGIIVGQRLDVFVGNPGHAIAKVGGVLIDPLDGKEHPLFAEAYHSLHSKIFFAWVNQNE